MTTRHFIVTGLTCILAAMGGCTSYEITPPVRTVVMEANVAYFSYEIETPFKNSIFARNTYEETKIFFRDSSEIAGSESIPEGEKVSIKLEEHWTGGACAQEYLTGLSLGIIPSWCSRTGLYLIKLQLSDSEHICESQAYSIGSNSFAHLILLPIALAGFSESGKSPLDLYKDALASFLANAKCSG